MIKKFTILLISAFLISCSKSETTDQENKETPSEEVKSIVFDVRSAEEFQTGHLKNAINIPHSEISDQIINHAKNKDAKIVLYCKSGKRAGIAKQALEDNGYTDVTNAGGYEDLKKQDPE